MEDKGMLTGNLWKAIPLFAFPVAATSILEQLSSLIATVVIGKVPGPEGTLGMAAVGANTPIMSLILNLFIGISLGTNVVIANAIGRDDQQTVTRAVHTSVLMSLIGFAVVIIGELYAEPLLAALSVPAETLPTAALFLRVYLLGMPSILLYNFEAAIFRSVGITRMPLQALMVSTVVNVGLDLVFVPVLHWGVAGLAAASAIAYTLSAATLFYRLTKTSSPVRLDPQQAAHRRRRARTHRQDRPSGGPSVRGLRPRQHHHPGRHQLARHRGHGRVERRHDLEYVFYNLLNSFSQACTTFVGQAFGARNIPRCKQVLKVCLAEDLVVAIATVTSVVFFGKSILAVFNSDPNVVSIGYIRACTIFPAYIFSMCYENFSGYLRGFGISLAPAILTALGICGIRFWWVFGVFPAHHDFQTIMLVYPISLCVTAILIVSSALVIHPAKTFGKKDTNGTAVAVVA